jgi:hypothetical protein
MLVAILATLRDEVFIFANIGAINKVVSGYVSYKELLGTIQKG